MSEITIEIKGPQGTGKGIIASYIFSILLPLGINVEYYDEGQPIPPPVICSRSNVRDIDANVKINVINTIEQCP